MSKMAERGSPAAWQNLSCQQAIVLPVDPVQHSVLVSDRAQVDKRVILLPLYGVGEHFVCDADRGEFLLGARSIRLGEVNQLIGMILTRELWNQTDQHRRVERGKHEQQKGGTVLGQAAAQQCSQGKRVPLCMQTR